MKMICTFFQGFLQIKMHEWLTLTIELIARYPTCCTSNKNTHLGIHKNTHYASKPTVFRSLTEKNLLKHV